MIFLWSRWFWHYCLVDGYRRFQKEPWIWRQYFLRNFYIHIQEYTVSRRIQPQTMRLKFDHKSVEIFDHYESTYIWQHLTSVGILSELENRETSGGNSALHLKFCRQFLKMPAINSHDLKWCLGTVGIKTELLGLRTSQVAITLWSAFITKPLDFVVTSLQMQRRIVTVESVYLKIACWKREWNTRISGRYWKRVIRNWYDNIKMDVRGTGCNGVKWIHVGSNVELSVNL